MPISATLVESDKSLPSLKEIKAKNSKENPDLPPETAWIWGKNDEIGRVNLLTPERVLNAKGEIKDGVVSPLNWSILLPEAPSYSRPHATWKLRPMGHWFDDEIIMNTQSGSQFDGLRHFPHLPTNMYYNNLTPEEIESESTRCGMQAMADRGIAGRGVLLDFASWADAKGISANAFDTYKITLDQLKEVAAYQNVEFQVGDVLLVRTGWMRSYEKKRAEDPKAVRGKPEPHHIGISQGEDVKEWLHDNYFSIVGADSPSFEAWPFGEVEDSLHNFLLCCWGVMIGEMLDLEDLSEKCKKAKRWSFFFTCAPINSPGGVATLSNSLAIL